MFENAKTESKNVLTTTQKFLSFLLGCGVLLATTHGALFGDHHSDLTPVDLTSKIVKDLHIHNDFSLQHSHIIADPRSLRHIRSEGDKTAENDSLRGNWDVYQA